MGIFVGLFTALGSSALNVFLKKLSDFEPNFLTWMRFTAASVSLALLVSFFIGWDVPSYEFWLIMLFAKVPLEIANAWLTTKSLHISDLSIVGPLQASLSSIFLIPVGFVILGELPTQIGLLGVFSVIIGSFFLGWKQGEKLNFGIKNVLQDRGAQFAIAAALLASIAIAVTKLSFHYAHPLLAAFYASILLSAVLTPHMLRQKKIQVSSRVKPLGGLWLTSSVSIALHNYGLSLMPAVYFISIKRFSIFFDVFFGKKFFDEEQTSKRLIGAILMVAGVALIAFG